MTLLYESNPKPLELWRKRGDLGEHVASYIRDGELKIVDPNEARPVGSVRDTTDVAYFCLYVTRDGNKCSLDWHLRNHQKLIRFYEKIGEVKIISNDASKWKNIQVVNYNKDTKIISMDEWYAYCEEHVLLRK